jgi:hypothetical protein
MPLREKKRSVSAMTMLPVFKEKAPKSGATP